MVSHCTASLKLTPWHEGTFASPVIYSPPQLPPTPTPLPSSYVQHSLTLTLSPPSFSLLPQNDIHYFIVKQESFFSCSPGTKRQGNGGKMKHPQAKSQLGKVSRWQLELFSLWPGAPVENGSVLHYGSSNVTDSLGKYSCMYEALAAGSGWKARDCLSESLQGFRLAPITGSQNHASAHSQIRWDCLQQSQIQLDSAFFFPQIKERMVGMIWNKNQCAHWKFIYFLILLYEECYYIINNITSINNKKSNIGIHLQFFLFWIFSPAGSVCFRKKQNFEIYRKYGLGEIFL